VRLTIKSAAVLKLPHGKSDHIEFDEDVHGFGLRLRAGGSRTWVYQYRIGTKQRRMVLGSATSVPLTLARETAGRLEAKVKLGGDPAMDKEIARGEAFSTFGMLVERYLAARKSDWRPKSESTARRHLIVCARALHRLPIAAVSQRDVADLLSDLARSAGDVTSNRVRATLSAFLGWVIREGIRLPEGNVASYTNKHEEKSRSRVLSYVELKAIWAACPDDNFGAVLKLLILTGQRANEIARLRWDEVYDDKIILLAERTKNHRTHVVPLSGPANTILGTLNAGGRTCVFGRDDTGFWNWSTAKKRIDLKIAEVGALPHWTPHDIRRSVATHMAELGVQPHIVEAVLNHASGHKGGIAGVYNRGTYDKEKREALNLWAEHVTALVEGRKAVVMPMKRA
jgi:integrase